MYDIKPATNLSNCKSKYETEEQKFPKYQYKSPLSSLSTNPQSLPDRQESTRHNLWRDLFIDVFPLKTQSEW